MEMRGGAAGGDERRGIKTVENCKKDVVGEILKVSYAGRGGGH